MEPEITNSLEHSVDSLLPVKLEHQDGPTPTQLANLIDPWVKWWFKRSLVSNLHYEHQLYGPYNVYLQSIFPAVRRFAIIPQALVRPTIVPHGIPPSDSRLSAGSTGGTHWGRDSGKSKNGKTFPDFVAVKVIATPEKESRKKYVVCVVEVKLGSLNDKSELGQAEGQMNKYMENLVKHTYRVKNLKGYLLIGEQYSEFQINDESGEVVYEPAQFKNLFAQGDPLTLALCAIAAGEWNRDSVDNAQLEVDVLERVAEPDEV